MREKNRPVFRLRRVRKIPAAVSLLALAGASLVACAAGPGPQSADDADCERPASNDALTSVVTVPDGDQPDSVDVNVPDEGGSYGTDKTVFADLVTGDGPALTDTTQLIELDVSFYSPVELPSLQRGVGDRLSGVSTSGQGQDGSPMRSQLTEDLVLEQYPGLEGVLECATAGSRIVAGIPLSELGEQAAAQYVQAGVPEDGSLIAVVDLNEVYPGAAWGKPQYNGETNMPSVVRGPDGRPGITVPDKAAPKDLVVETLLKGDGKEIGEGDAAIVRYTGVLWETGDVFDSAWEKGSALVMNQPMVEGFTKAVQGQTVGSQVLAVIPPDLGYGDQEGGAVPPNSTLVFVVDIVGVQE